ncbi:UNVERIFIED_CONTAM: Target of Myb protein 1 [Trichonephila clavipes]
MQSRIVELIDKVGNEKITEDLLQVNDELNNLFLRYERFEKKRAAMAKAPVPEQTFVESKPLIDLEETPISQQLDGLDLGQTDGASAMPENSTSAVDEFDMLAQSRTLEKHLQTQPFSPRADFNRSGNCDCLFLPLCKDKTGTDHFGLPKASRPLAKSHINPIRYFIFKGFGNTNDSPATDVPAAEPEGAQAEPFPEEFDRFLASRAAAAERLPTINPASSPSSNNLEKEREDAKALSPMKR